MKRAITIFLWTIGAFAAAFVLFVAFAWATEWQPVKEKVIHSNSAYYKLPDTLKIVTWNTGYAGLGADMDFFMDGGTHTRTSRERADENLEKITRFLAESDADIILLQEVDRDAKRSFHVDQLAKYREALPGYHGYFALNYKVIFVPVPLRAPLGKVEAGTALFSRIEPQEVVRYQYDSRFSFPVRLFNLKRGWLAARFGDVWISTTHNTAYDTGDMRTIEMQQLYKWLSSKSLTITGGDWNQNPTGYTPSPAEVDDPHFSPRSIPENTDFQALFDASTPTVRYLYEPLSERTTTSLIDFFIVSQGIKCLEIKTIDLGFENSDHNPVAATFVIERP